MKRGHGFEKDQRWVSGSVWSKKTEGESNVIVLWCNKNKRN